MTPRSDKLTYKPDGNTPQIERHCLTVRFIHWTVTLSTFLLIFTGFGQMPVYRRYMVDQLPGMAWTSDFAVTLNLHYIAAAVLIFASVYHLVYHGLRRDFSILPRRGDLKQSYLIMKAIVTGGKEPPSHKYLAEQRLAYVFIAISIGVTIITGIFKVLKNMPSVSFSDGFLDGVTMLHNIGTFMVIFGIIAHLGAFIIKENRKLLPGMFTGRVCLDYAEHRHPLWCDELFSGKKGGDEEKLAG
ncbi:MAG: hypothetical protein CVU89_08755 [Firmicutes bacterium HGW-Firmicutes-14]|nr:MAG: hypothetical protein CVU89_08755 [Firmicutes bacterium HGW-Firmicutes-14]